MRVVSFWGEGLVFTELKEKLPILHKAFKRTPGLSTREEPSTASPQLVARSLNVIIVAVLERTVKVASLTLLEHPVYPYPAWWWHNLVTPAHLSSGLPLQVRFHTGPRHSWCILLSPLYPFSYTADRKCLVKFLVNEQWPGIPNINSNQPQGYMHWGMF